MARCSAIIIFLAQLLAMASMAACAPSKAAEPAAAPAAPAVPETPVAPTSPETPKAPAAPAVPATPVAPTAPETPTTPAAPAVTVPPPEAPVSPGAAGTNVMAVLKQAGCNVFVNMLKNTETIKQIQSQLSTEDSEGLTILAPSDGAFAELKPGMMNALREDEKAELMQFHVLPKYYTQGQLQEASNPVITMAAGSNGPFGFNVTSSGSSNSSVNITTGVDSTSVAAPFYSKAPLAVYKIGKVLLPNDLFGVKKAHPHPHRAALSPAGAPVPAAGAAAAGKAKAPVPDDGVPSNSPVSVRDSNDSSFAIAVTAPAPAGIVVFTFFVLFAVAAAAGGGLRP